MSKSKMRHVIALGTLSILLAGTADARPSRRRRPERAERVDHRQERRQAETPVVIETPELQVSATVEVMPSVSTHSHEEVQRHSEATQEVRYETPVEEAERPTLREAPNRLWHLGVNLGAGPALASAGSAAMSASLDLYAGLRIGGFALQGELWLQYRDYFEPGEGIGQSMGLLTAQLWLRDKLWVKAGIGGARLNQDGFAEARGTALMGAAGYDILDTRRVVFNAHLKSGTGLYRQRGAFSTLSAGLGFTWY